MFQQGRILHGLSLRIPGQDGCKIETEAIDMIVRNPVPKTVQDKAPHHRIVAVHGIPAAAEVVIGSIRRQQIIGFVVDAPEGYAPPVLIAFRRMIEYHIQYHFDPDLMELPHHVLHFLRCKPQGTCHGIS